MPENEQPYRLPHAKFPTGQLVITPSALHQIGLEEVTKALHRHIAADWGEVDEHDRRANDDALRDGTRLLSAYRSTDGTKFWIITEADRSFTSGLLPEEY